MDLIKPLLSLSYWFGNGIQPFHPLVGRGLLIFMSGLVVASIAIAVYVYLQKQIAKELRQVLQRVTALLSVMGVVGLFMYWFNYEGIPVFSMRFWYIVWFGVAAYWAYSIQRGHRDHKKTLASVAERAKYEKWLTKPKR